MSLPQVVIVGAGPAGVRAAEVLVQAGLQPTLVDENSRIGGQIYRQPPVGFQRSARQLYGFEAPKAAALQRSFTSLIDKLHYLPESLVWGGENQQLKVWQQGQHRTLAYTHLLLCTGAIDRVLPFPGHLLPGVYTLGAAQIALKAQACVIGEPVALVGTGPLLYLVAYQYAKAGAKIAVVLDSATFNDKWRASLDLCAQAASLAKGIYFYSWLRLHGIRIIEGVSGVEALGEQQVEAITWRKNGRTQRLACTAIASGFGLRSETQLADIVGCRFAFHSLNQQWLPECDQAGRSSVAGVYLAGDGASIAGADAAELAGQRAALAVLEDLGHRVDPARCQTLEKALQRYQVFRRGLERAFPVPSHWVLTCADSEVICRCEEINAGQLRQQISQMNIIEINRLKALSRLGMGRCQGRMCAAAAAEILAAQTGQSLAQIGYLRAQTPIKPIHLSWPAAPEQGQ